jgi:alpha-ketoglutarate-dependent taurine dioxygenase
MRSSPLRNDYGIIIERSSPSQRLADLDIGTVKDMIRTSGVVLFRGFDASVDEFEKFTLHFADKMVPNWEAMAADGAMLTRKGANERENVSGDHLTATVNGHRRPLAWHAEDANLPISPDIMFFYCARPPVRGGATLLTDGIEVVDQCPPDIHQFLHTHRLSYTNTLPLGFTARFLGTTRDKLQDEVRDLVARFKDGEQLKIDVVGEEARMTFSVPLARTPRWSKKKAFCNRHLLERIPSRVLSQAELEAANTVHDGVIEPNDIKDTQAIMHIINNIAHFNAYHLHWQATDMVMLDNTRVMHARGPLQQDERRILTRRCFANF